tara:strand:+ start:1250 stop:1966 length:717 start_codon:yes stop_codon:yes gene_type:complete
MSEPKVSVIIHSYNRYEYLVNALKSIENQTFKNFEIILINDDSDQREYYETNFGPKVKKIDIKKSETPEWKGSRQALINIGVDHANGKYIALLDDDDIWMDKKLEVQVNELENSNEKFSSTEGYYGEGIYDSNIEYKKYNSEHFYKILKKKYKKTNFLKKGSFPEIWDYEFLNVHNCIIKSSVMVEKELFQTVGGIRGLPEKADYDCWLSLLKLTNCLYIDRPLFYYDGLHGSGRKYN